jgi:cytochrome c biogenesis protein CcmG/thiol:disulfide interchange protein DsbE
MKLIHLPLLIFICITLFLGYVLFVPKPKPASSMQNKPLIAFELPTWNDTTNPIFSSTSLQGQYALINIFGSWCQACIFEHPHLLYLAQKTDIPIIGIAWRDTPQKITHYLKQYGNPYRTIALDAKGEAIINLGITGAPESFLVSPEGKIIYHLAGPLTQEIIDSDILPMIAR